MTRIKTVDPGAAGKRTAELLASVQKALGMTPNMMKTMAHSTVVLDGYLSFSGSLGRGALDAKFREQIALAVAEANGCDYCLSAHTAIGNIVGLGAGELAAARQATGADAHASAGLKFAQEIVRRRGQVSDDSLAEVRRAGYSDGEIAEIVANVALNVFTNYFNAVAGTEVDFPRVTAKAV
jgi:uncharacterized peroxidase-related enzyme